jgi:hypothetical protein
MSTQQLSKQFIHDIWRQAERAGANGEPLNAVPD